MEAVALPDTTRQMLQYDDAESVRWRDGDGHRWQAFYLRWQPSRLLYDRVRVALAKSHSPEICLRGIGMKLVTELESFQARPNPQLPLLFRHYRFEVEGEQLSVFLSVSEDMKEDPRGFFRTTHAGRFWAALAGSRNRGQRSLEVAVWGQPDAASAQVAFEKLLPQIIAVN